MAGRGIRLINPPTFPGELESAFINMPPPYAFIEPGA